MIQQLLNPLALCLNETQVLKNVPVDTKGMDIIYNGFSLGLLLKTEYLINRAQIQKEWNQIYLNSIYPFYYRNSNN